jgi:hypothetical protein
VHPTPSILEQTLTDWTLLPCSDVNGVYGAAGAGVAVGRGAGGIVLTNQNGAVLSLSGRQAGLIVAADLNGLVISLR